MLTNLHKPPAKEVAVPTIFVHIINALAVTILLAGTIGLLAGLS